MATTIRTNTSAPQAQPNESFFGRIGRAIKETISPTPTPVRGAIGPDRYSKTPASLASTRRLTSVTSGYGTEGPTARRGSGAPVSDAQLVSFLDELGASPTRTA